MDEIMSSSMNRLGGHIPPSIYFKKIFLAFLEAIEDETTDVFEAYDQYIKGIEVHPGYTWKIPVYGNVSAPQTSSPSKEEFSRVFLLGQALSGAQTMSTSIKLGLKYLKIDGNGHQIFLEAPDVNPVREKVDVKTKELEIQNEFPELFLFALAHKNSRIKADSLENLMYALSFGLPTVIYASKALMGIERPYERANTILDIPKHSSWPGGHGFIAAAISTLIYFSIAHQQPPLADLSRIKLLLEHATNRISYNRQQAGLHWKMDGIDGMNLGGKIIHHWLDLSLQSKDETPGSIKDFLPMALSIAAP